MQLSAATQAQHHFFLHLCEFVGLFLQSTQSKLHLLLLRRACRDAGCVSPFADLTEYCTQTSLKEVTENVILLRLLRMITKRKGAKE